MIIEKRAEVVAVVDDQFSGGTIHGVQRWSSAQFRRQIATGTDLIAVDLSANGVFGALLDETAVTRLDLVEILADLELPAVYQSPKAMKELTIARQSEWCTLRSSFKDEISRRTLDAILLLRLTFDRMGLRHVIVSPRDEYFSARDANATFSLRRNEIFCDAGAHVGSIVRKFIAATGGAYRAIHAFEPDRKNFARLSELAERGLDQLTLHNAALGDFTGSTKLVETGTMGSHVSEEVGEVEIAMIRLDDAIDDVTFIKMDVEGFERRALLGAVRLIRECSPRLAIASYHYADDLLEICQTIRTIGVDYELRLRHHSNYYYDSIIYAQPCTLRVRANRPH